MDTARGMAVFRLLASAEAAGIGADACRRDIMAKKRFCNQDYRGTAEPEKVAPITTTGRESWLRSFSAAVPVRKDISAWQPGVFEASSDIYPIQNWKIRSSCLDSDWPVLAPGGRLVVIQLPLAWRIGSSNFIRSGPGDDFPPVLEHGGADASAPEKCGWQRRRPSQRAGPEPTFQECGNAVAERLAER